VVTDLHPRDEKVLTAKALAYEVLAQREQSLRKEGDDRFREVDESIGSIETLPGAAEAQVSLNTFLGEALAYLDGRLTRTFKKAGPVKSYLAHLQQTIKNPVSITTQCQQWLAALHAIGARYLKQYSLSPAAIPKMRLGMDVDSSCCLRGLSGKTEEEDKERTIWVYYTTKEFRLESYFAIPYILSHEFWCHGLSKRCSGQKNPSEEPPVFGCSPKDAFEEGWMDFVQHQILSDEIRRIIGDGGLHPVFRRHCTGCYEERNDRAKRNDLYYGGLVAEYFLGFLGQWSEHLGGMDARHLFYQLSLDLNALGCSGEAKGELVDELAWRVGAQAPGEEMRPAVAKQYDHRIEKSKKYLASGLRSMMSDRGILPNHFLKMLKIEPL
jgi:hypothetical protein